MILAIRSPCRCWCSPGANGSFTLKEDDGSVASAASGSASADSCDGQTHVADTRMSFDWKNTDNATQFTVSPVEGCAVAIPAQRNWEVVFRGVAQPDMQNVRIEIDGKACDTAEITYDQQTLSLSVVVRDVPSTACLNVTISDGLQIAENSVEQDVLDVLLHGSKCRTFPKSMRCRRFVSKECVHSGLCAPSIPRPVSATSCSAPPACPIR